MLGNDPKSTLSIQGVPVVAFSLPLAGVKKLQICWFSQDRLLSQSSLPVIFRPHDFCNAVVLRRCAVASASQRTLIPWTINRVSTRGVFREMKQSWSHWQHWDTCITQMQSLCHTTSLDVHHGIWFPAHSYSVPLSPCESYRGPFGWVKCALIPHIKIQGVAPHEPPSCQHTPLCKTKLRVSLHGVL